MNTSPKIRIFPALLSILMLGVSQPVMPMQLEAAHSSVTAQSLTRDEMAFLMGDAHRNHGDHAGLSYLSQKEMLETEGKAAPAVVAGAAVVAAGVIGTGGSVLNDIKNGNSVNWQNAASNGVAAAWGTGAAILATLSGVGLVGSTAIGGMAGSMSMMSCSGCHSSK